MTYKTACIYSIGLTYFPPNFEYIIIIIIMPIYVDSRPPNPVKLVINSSSYIALVIVICTVSQ